MSDWLKGYADGADLSGNITFTGWVSHEQIPAFLARADVAVAPYPALENFYFSPLKLFEYMALGKAIVASDIGQISDVIDDGHNGLLTKAGDAMEHADALEKLYTDRPLRQQLASAAIDSSKQYTWKHNAEQVESMFHDLIHPQLKHGVLR